MGGDGCVWLVDHLRAAGRGGGSGRRSRWRALERSGAGRSREKGEEQQHGFGEDEARKVGSQRGFFRFFGLGCSGPVWLLGRSGDGQERSLARMDSVWVGGGWPETKMTWRTAESDGPMPMSW